MEKELREKVEARIKLMGLKKEHVANRIGLDKVRFSQTLTGKRNITEQEKAALILYLGI